MTHPLDGARASALRTIRTEIAGLDALRASIENGMGEAFSEAVRLISSATGRVIVTGMGKSGHVGRKIAATFASTGTAAHFVHPGEASHGDLGMIRNEDVILALSWSGETAELSDIIAYSRRYGVGLVALTSNPESTLAVEADIALVLPKVEEACPNGLAPTTSTTMQITLGDALAVALLEARGFTPEDFRTFHPGGKLGAKLAYVRDIMHRGEAVPRIAETVRMGEAIVEMSSRGFGCVAVVDGEGRMTGVISDGDLRRHMRPDLTTVPVTEVMTRNPRVVREQMLAVEALDQLNKSKITALFVVDAGQKPVGIVHVHDLLRIGVA
ncbi:KpsF/GutQ family sugar-phosphate isomerase [Rhabdaerophilum sp. SD176]|uniref:KpsF/GutQ family sugar-phosphate isomerase n=1 Tax=Rhabdaerophilum sp. SD176 TaxID=2983548 RepID=UPI0024DFF198|nr:KpsF/GutQ family sugar-phosphate isomerase [Rhabdaerophilum sp. SD176]